MRFYIHTKVFAGANILGTNFLLFVRKLAFMIKLYVTNDIFLKLNYCFIVKNK